MTARAVSQACCKFVRKVNGLYLHQMMVLRLTGSAFWVDVRLVEINGRWIASADTPDGPSLGLGDEPMPAIEGALEPYHGIADELLASLRPATLG